MKRVFAALALGAALAGCATQQVTMIPLTEESRSPTPTEIEIQIFRGDALPDRPYRAIGRLNVHLEKTALMPSNADAAIEQLLARARLAGADAIIGLEEDRSRLNETTILNISATAIAYTD